ncbi:MAG: hypothetical protein J0H63_12930, partial [Rhizobiales bacterium]|nr:hypothetical protein [Hyphomicrobiales bacterium]
GIRGGKENGTSGDKLGYLSFHTRNSATSQAEAMRISSGGKVGIGDTTPDYRLDVEDTTTITSGGTIGSAHQLTANPAAASTAYLTGLDGRIYTAGSSNFTGALQGLEADAVHQGAGTASSIRAVRAAAVNNNGGAVASGTGGAFSVENASGGGVITNGTAVSAEVDHKNTTTIGTATGLYSRVDNGSTGMITNAYGVYAELANSGGGAIANWYGLYIPALTGAAPTTNRYDVYVGDAGRN